MHLQVGSHLEDEKIPTKAANGLKVAQLVLGVELEASAQPARAHFHLLLREKFLRQQTNHRYLAGWHRQADFCPMTD